MCKRLSDRLAKSAKHWEKKYRALGDDKLKGKFEKMGDSMTFP